MQISVIVCTYNRSLSLIDTLESIKGAISTTDVSVEVLVVDNNSTDDTKGTLSDYMSNQGNENFRYLFQGVQGKVHALNLGVLESQGKILAFTDDDAIVDLNWIRCITESFSVWKPDCIGGKVIPIWLGPKPEWLTLELYRILALRDLGDTVFEMSTNPQPRMFFGVNIAYSRDVFRRFGLFDDGVRSQGEDIEMFERLLRNSCKIVYNPGMVVHHKIFPERLTRSYFRKWHYRSGKDWARLDSGCGTRLFGIPTFVIRDLLRYSGKSIGSAVRLDRKKLFYYYLKIIYLVSYAWQIFYSHLRRKNITDIK
jgi:glucosyl-dolichyl phosphate glucuronosyltransferase